VIALCPHCERSGTLIVTAAVTIGPVYVQGLSGAHLRVPDNVMAMLSCRHCGWRVEGRLENLSAVGTVVTTGQFVALEPPVVPLPPQTQELAPP
jgi:hypothetical protein